MEVNFVVQKRVGYRKVWKRKPLAESIAVALVCLSVAACDADVRPLEEQIETANLNLGSIAIAPPVNALDPLIIASNQQLQLSLAGTTVDGESVAVSSNNRRWSSNDSSVLSINEDGVIVGQGPGIAVVSVVVGESIATNPISITVSDAPLIGISRIVSSADTVGVSSDTLDPCQPIQFSAVGDFGSGDERALPNVVWSVDTASIGLGAEVFTDSATLPGSTLLVGRTPSDGGANVPPITLTATTIAVDDSDDAPFTESRELMVADSLTSLSVTPGFTSVPAGRTTQYAASATYSTNTAQSATSGVDWSVVNTEIANVQGVGDNVGIVTSLRTGSTTVTASCGPMVAMGDLEVTGNIGDLSFSRSGNLLFQLEDGFFNDLRVSQSDPFDPDPNLDVSDEVDWESSDSSILTVDSDGDLTFLALGTVVVTATLDPTQIDITVTIE